MTDRIETQGKTVEEAVSEALLQLGARRDEVEIKVVEQPKSGFMGFLGGRPAKVMVRKKQSRGRSRGGQDFRQDEDYKAHDLSENKPRRGRGSRRRPARGGQGSGGRQDQPVKAEEKKDGRQDSRGRNNQRRRPASEAKSGGRNDAQAKSADAPKAEANRNDRTDRNEGGGRGGRSRRGQSRDRGRPNQNEQRQTEARDQQPEQAKDQGNNQSRDQGQGRDQGGDGNGRPSRRRRGTRGGRGRGRGEGATPDRQDQAVVAEAQTDTKPETRPETRPENNARSQREAPQTQERRDTMDSQKQQPEAAAPEAPTVETPAVETPAVEAAPTPVAAPAAPLPPKKKAWGGLGAGLKRRKAEAAAAAAAAARAERGEADPEPTPTPAPRVSAPPRSDDRGGYSGGSSRDRRPSRSGGGSYTSSRDDNRDNDEVLIKGVSCVKYAARMDPVTEDGMMEALETIASGTLARAGFPCECAVEPGEYLQVKISTDEESAGMLIGRHGQTVDAVEHLVERMASNVAGDRVRMNLDINEYRQRRAEELHERAAVAVARVLETGESVHMESMDARERRLVHMSVADEEGVETFTMVGSGGKHVVISKARPEEDRPSEDAGD